MFVYLRKKKHGRYKAKTKDKNRILQEISDSGVDNWNRVGGVRVTLL